MRSDVIWLTTRFLLNWSFFASRSLKSYSIWSRVSLKSFPVIANGAYSINWRNWCLYSSSFCLVVSISFSILAISVEVASLPSRISCNWMASSSLRSCINSDSKLDSLSLLSATRFSNSSCLLSIETSFSRLATSDDFLRKRNLTFSRFFFRSSYLRTPSTSLYAEHKRRFSVEVLVSAKATICSESKKKNRAMSLLRMKSLIKTSEPIVAASSFLTPSINISTFSFSVTMS